MPAKRVLDQPPRASGPRSILITGASSGLGAALAAAFARPGVQLSLLGRDRSRLETIAAEASGAGAVARIEVVDVTDRTALASAIEEIDAQAPLDLVIANAGISGGFAGRDDAETRRRIFAVNVDGLLNTVEPVLPHLMARRHGQIALMSSLASFRGFPNAPAYCASKAAVRLYGEGLRGRLGTFGVGVSVVCPGFVRTPMTENNPFPMPFLMEPARAALIIRRGLARNRARIAFPWPTYLGARLAAVLPASLVDGVMARLPGKE